MPRYSYIQIFHFNYFRVIDHFPYSILSTLRIFILRSYGSHFEEGSWEHGRPNAGSKQKLASALCFTRAALCFMQATAHAAAVPGKGRNRRFSFGRIKMLFSEKFSQKIHRRLMYLASSWMGLRLKSLKCSCCPLDNHEDFLFEKCTTLHFSSWDDSGCPSGRKKRGRPDVSFAQIILPFCPSSMQRWD